MSVEEIKAGGLRAEDKRQRIENRQGENIEVRAGSGGK